MIAPEALFDGLKQRGVGIFAGVPDSLLKDFCAYVDEHSGAGEHVITANEGNAVALAAGYHLSTGGVGAVYMQNSGFGNAVNPLTSLTDAEDSNWSFMDMGEYFHDTNCLIASGFSTVKL